MIKRHFAVLFFATILSIGGYWIFDFLIPKRIVVDSPFDYEIQEKIRNFSYK